MIRKPGAMAEAYCTLSEMNNGEVTLANVRMVIVVAGLVQGGFLSGGCGEAYRQLAPELELLAMLRKALEVVHVNFPQVLALV